MKARKWIMIMAFLWLALITGGVVHPAYAAETNHDVSISWFYGEDDSGALVDGEAGTKLNTTVIQDVPNGEFDFTEYTKNPDGATFYKMYGILPIIRINGNYYILMSKYFAGNSPYDDLNNIINFTNADADVDIKLYYSKVPTYTPTKLDKIKISVDGSINENLTEPHQYSAYQIFHVAKSKDVQEDVTTDDTIGQTISGEETGFSYYIKESDEWYPVISNMTNWFTLSQTTEEGVYLVSLADGVPAQESTAIAIAAELEQHTENKTAITITSGEAKLDNDPGYYLIVSPVNSNLILATTNIDITEKAFYPSIKKTVKEEDKNSAIGSQVHFTSTISIPKGSKAKMVITDTMTEGLTFDTNSLQLNPNINYNIESNEHGFTITIPAENIKELASQNDTELILSYSAELNKKAIIENRDDNSISGNINTIKMNYANYIQESSVDVNTTKFTLLKYAGKDTNKTPIGGATFNLLDANGNKIQFYEIIPNQRYRLATSEDSSSMTDIMTAAGKTIEIEGLDADTTYQLKEIKAPQGYDLLTETVAVQAPDDLSLVIEVANNTNSVLPSTGENGIYLYYVIGACLLVGGILIVIASKKSKKDMDKIV